MKTPRGEINDSVIQLLNHPELLEQMQTAKSPEECYDMVKDTIDVSFEDFKDSMGVARQFLQEAESGLLSDEELDLVAGGKQLSDEAVAGIGFGVSVGIGAAAGAAGAV